MAGTDFAKGWIFTSLALSVIGVASHFVLDHYLVQARSDRNKAYNQLGTTYSLGEDIGILEDEKQNDLYRVKSAGGTRQGEYFQKQAQDAGLDLAPNLGKDKEETPREASGFIDKSYEITFNKRPGQEKQGFERQKIARFLFNIEANTKLLTVSEVTLDAANVKDPTDDMWNLRLFVTERRPKSNETPAAQ
ncbi:MAG: hypothetical protein IPH13_04620 [Planctomycetes bacterium]|nr:hypothetical protein [Planctomycetota bacterium]MCC7169500.1 hypothetical protein [Planctomycetota bacterium]